MLFNGSCLFVSILTVICIIKNSLVALFFSYNDNVDKNKNALVPIDKLVNLVSKSNYNSLFDSYYNSSSSDSFIQKRPIIIIIFDGITYFVINIITNIYYRKEKPSLQLSQIKFEMI